MSDQTFFDRLMARAQGKLAPADQEQLERELAADPALRDLAEDFARVHALTAMDPLPALRPETSFEALEGRLVQPVSAARRVAAAALLLALAGGSFLAGRLSSPDPETLLLSAIELDEPADPPLEPDDLVARWADYDPRGERGVRFLTSLEEAELLARAVQRPLLVYGSYPGCPMCKALDERVFSDEGVKELAERTVPVRIDLAQLPEAEQRSLTIRGYPFLEMWRENGRTTHSLPRNPDPALFLEGFHDGLEKSGATGEQPPWDDLRAMSGRLVAARTHELEGDLARSERDFRALAGDPRVPEPISARARAGLRRLSDGARSLLLEARAVAAGDADEARRLLERGLERFRATSFESDLRAALERLARDGRFPELAEADRSA